MEVVIHYPKNEEMQIEFKRLVATVHADLAGSYINRLPCSIEQKCEIIKLVCIESMKS